MPKMALAAVIALLVAVARVIGQTSSQDFPQAVRTAYRRTLPSGEPLMISLMQVAMPLGQPAMRRPSAGQGAQQRPRHELLRADTGRAGADGRAAGSRRRVMLEQPAGATATTLASFDGINSWGMEFAGGDDQGPIDPPDVGLCVGNGFVLETVNSAVQIYDAGSPGVPLIPAVATNKFRGYETQYNGTTGVAGKFRPSKSSCFYDVAAGRWFHLVLYLTQDENGMALGPNHLDLAVSASPDPTGLWWFYKIPTTNDGTEGTLNHACPNGPCLNDFPRMAVNAQGVYITTNEYDFRSQMLMSANVLALPKAPLLSGAASVVLSEFQTPQAPSTSEFKLPGSNLCPSVRGADSPPSQHSQLFVSAALIANSEVVVWRLSDTAALAEGPLTNTSLTLRADVVPLGRKFTLPPYATQPPTGPYPLGQCLSSANCPAFPGTGATNETIAYLNTGSLMVMSASSAARRLWGTLTTGLTNGRFVAGALWFAIDPRTNRAVGGGVVSVTNNNVVAPSIAMTAHGKGVLSFTLVGDDYFPSAAYVALARRGTGPVTVAAPGLGLSDGASGYVYFSPSPFFFGNAQWGNYGTATVDPADGSVWAATEYIAQSCTLEQYVASPDHSCNGTRTALTNWATRITRISVQ